MNQAADKPAERAVSKPPADKRAPVPDQAARNAALAKVKEIYADDFAGAGSPSRKSELAAQLATQADATKDNTDRWVLLVEALRLATDAGDTATALPLIDRIPFEYAVERDASRLEALSKLATKVSAAQSSELSRRCLDLAQELDERANTDVAARILAIARAAAQKARNADLAAEAARLTAKQKERQKVEKDLEPLLEKLATNPDDADLCLEVGQILCFRAGRWVQGLKILQTGSDPTLSKLARAELSSPTTTLDLIRLGDGWWDWAESQKAPVKLVAQTAAVRHYTTALAGVEGLDRARLEKRIQSAVAASGGTGELMPLVKVPSIEIANAENGNTKDGTFLGKAFTCGGKKYPVSVFTHPPDQSTAKISFRVPAGVRRLRGAAGVFSLPDTPPAQQPGSPVVMRILADGEVVWTSPQLTKRDQSAPFDVVLRGTVRLELQTTSLGSASGSWAAWLDPMLVK